MKTWTDDELANAEAELLPSLAWDAARANYLADSTSDIERQADEIFARRFQATEEEVSLALAIYCFLPEPGAFTNASLRRLARIRLLQRRIDKMSMSAMELEIASVYADYVNDGS